MTVKYSNALETARKNQIPDNFNNQEELYAILQEAGFFWDSGIKKWEYYEPAAADDPTPLIMIRVWAEAEFIEEAADDLIKSLKKNANTKTWQLLEKSPSYQCRPPKQKEARIYLKFLPLAR